MDMHISPPGAVAGIGRTAEWTCTSVRQCAVAGIGRSLDAVSGLGFVIPLDGRVLGIAMHVLFSPLTYVSTA